MKNRILFATIIIFVFLSTSITYGQNKLLRGKVTTFDSIPLINASVRINSTKEIVLTDTIGNFSLMCNSPDKLKVTANGFISQKVKIPEQIKLVLINLKLKPTEEAKEIATGYGHVKDKEKLFSMATLGDKELDFSMYSDVFEIIRGRFPGVSIEGNEIIIRGKSTFLGSNAALLILDCIPTSAEGLNSVSPVSVKSINILKGGAAAIYGARGANGVVIVETKRGGE